jgi:hypothetical protein
MGSITTHHIIAVNARVGGRSSKRRHIQSHDRRGVLGAPPAPGMRTEYASSFSRQNCPSDVQSVSLHQLEGAGKTEGRPGVGLAHGPPATKKAGGSHHRFGRNNPAFPARMVLRLIRALLGDRRSCPRHRHRRQLGISTGMPGPHDFAVLSVLSVRPRNSALQHRQAIASHPACRDDREAPLVSERDGATIHIF